MNCRFLYLVGQLGPGGLERQLCFLLETMDRERYRPEVVVWNFRADETYVRQIEKFGIALHSFPNILTARGKLLAFRRMVMKMRPEVIHSYSFFTNFAAWWAAIGMNSIAIGSGRSDFTSEKRRCGFLLGRLSARWPLTQIYNNFAGAESARNARTLFAPKKVFVVRNGLDLAQFQRVPLPADGEVRILGIGALLQLKRWDRLLRAASALKKLGLNFVLDIAGGGPMRDSLERQARELGLSDRVTFRGHTDNIPGLLASSTLLVHTSDIEGCPNVVMEAMACGRAVVATNAGDIPCLVDDGKTGFVVDRRDHGKLIERLTTLITDRNLSYQMGAAGRAKAEREFGLDRFVSETFAAYRAAGWRDS